MLKLVLTSLVSFERVHIMPYCHRVQKYDYIKPGASNSIEPGKAKSNKTKKYGLPQGAKGLLDFISLF